jgi:CheY-like chemotaxis protein
MKPVILLIDDDMDDITLLKEALISVNNDCRILEALDSRKALASLKEARDNDQLPNLIVLDISMPILDGRELLAILKREEKLKDLPIVVMTTSSNISDINYCKQFNVDLITKPVELPFLYKTAERLLSYCIPK